MPKDTKFKPGQSGNPRGRPKGARNKLGEDFLTQLCDDFEAHGAAVIERVRQEDPQPISASLSAFSRKSSRSTAGLMLGHSAISLMRN